MATARSSAECSAEPQAPSQAPLPAQRLTPLQAQAPPEALPREQLPTWRAPMHTRTQRLARALALAG